MTKASSGGHHSEVTPWSHLRPPGSFFAVVNLTCWIGACLPSVIAEATTLDIYDSTFQFPKMYTIYFLHSFFIEFFFFSNGFRFGTTLAFWSSQLHWENLKKYKSDIFILLKLLIYHPEPNTPWEDFPLNLVCRVHDSEPASVQSKLQRKDPASLFLNFMQVQTALPHGTEQHVLVLFFFLPYLSYFECKRRNQRQTLSPKRGEKCAYLPSSSVIYQSVLRAAAHGAPLAHLDLHFVYYVQHPGATVTGIWWEQTC